MEWEIDIDNIGGIKSGKATFSDGHNIIQASNFKGKSSLINAVKTVLGVTGYFSETHPLTEGADKGRATLHAGDDEWFVDLTQTGLNDDANPVISRSGEPYLSNEQDQVCTRLFASLDERNPIRSAIREQNFDRLTELLKKPLDMEDIDRRIEKLASKQKSLERERDKARQAAKDIPQVQREVTQLEKEIEELKEKREGMEEEVEEDQDQKQIRSDLTDKETKLQNKENRIENLEEKIEKKQARLEEMRAEIESIEIPEEPKIETDIQEKESKIQELELQIDLLQDLYRSNRAVITENEIDLISDVDRQIDGDRITCWLSGDKTTTDEIERHLGKIQQKKKELESEKEDLSDEVEDIRKTKKNIKKKRNEKKSLENRVEQTEFNVEEHKDELQQAKEDREDLEQEVERLQDEFEEVEEELDSELTEIERNIGRKESQLSRKEEKLEELDEIAETEEKKDAEFQKVRDEKKELRERRQEKEDELKKKFNAAMEDFSDRFDPGFEAFLNKKTHEDGKLKEFNVTIARNEKDTEIDNLSEGEVELVGIITAMAGYQTFNVGERSPVIMIDGIGQLAAEHIRNLMNYFDDNAEMIITTAYPEAGEFDGRTITPSSWELVRKDGIAAN